MQAERRIIRSLEQDGLRRYQLIQRAREMKTFVMDCVVERAAKAVHLQSSVGSGPGNQVGAGSDCVLVNELQLMRSRPLCSASLVGVPAVHSESTVGMW